MTNQWQSLSTIIPLCNIPVLRPGPKVCQEPMISQSNRRQSLADMHPLCNLESTNGASAGSPWREEDPAIVRQRRADVARDYGRSLAAVAHGLNRTVLDHADALVVDRALWSPAPEAAATAPYLAN